MTHGAEVVNLGGLDLGNDPDEIGRIAQVAVVEEELHSGLVAVSVDVVDAARVETRRPADNPVDLTVWRRGHDVRSKARQQR